MLGTRPCLASVIACRRDRELTQTEPTISGRVKMRPVHAKPTQRELGFELRHQNGVCEDTAAQCDTTDRMFRAQHFAHENHDLSERAMKAPRHDSDGHAAL